MYGVCHDWYFQVNLNFANIYISDQAQEKSAVGPDRDPNGALKILKKKLYSVNIKIN